MKQRFKGQSENIKNNTSNNKKIIKNKIKLKDIRQKRRSHTKRERGKDCTKNGAITTTIISQQQQQNNVEKL